VTSTHRLRAAVSLAACGISAVTLAACTAKSSGGTSGGSGGSASAGTSSVLNVSFASAPSSLDPAYSCTFEDRALTDSLYVRLVDDGTMAGPDGTSQADYTKITPYLAKSWTTSNGGATYTFHLNTGWKFPDGDPMDANAVRFSLTRALTMNQCAATILNDLYSKPDLIKSITAPDPGTVVVSLTKPDPQVLAAFADTSGGIVDPKVVDAHGGVVANQVNTWMASHSAGGGAFILKSYAAGTSAVLTANPSYGGRQPASKQIDVTWTTSPSTQLLNMQNGTSDVAVGMGGSLLNSLKSDSSVKIASYDGTESMLMTMPNNKAPWTSLDVRKAVVEAVPTQEIISNVVYGYGKAYYGPIPPSMPGYSTAYGQPIAQNLADAKKLMAASGIKTPVNVTLDIVAGDQNQKTIATVIQSTLQQIGINITVDTLTSSAWNDAVYNGKSQSALRFDGPAIPNAGYYLQYDEDCASAYNTGHICIPANTPMLRQARATSDVATSNQLYAEIAKNWVADYPRVTLYQSLTPAVVATSVQSFYYSDSIDMRTWAK
jgi:peptide/nickel transport system substrate-binding protein